MTATTGSTISTSPTAAASLNARLLTMHGPTTCLGSTIGSLATFPAIPAMPDATVLDVHVSLADSTTAGSTFTSHVKIRYATAASTAETTDFYQTELGAISGHVTAVIGAPGRANAHFDAALPDGRYSARVFDLGRISTVIAQAETTLPAASISGPLQLEELGNWHGLSAYFSAATLTGAEVFTVAAGPCAPIQAIYSSEYLFPNTTEQDVKTLVESMLGENGWPMVESYENILAFAGPFGGEAHIDASGSDIKLTLVGEYALGSDEDCDEDYDEDCDEKLSS